MRISIEGAKKLLCDAKTAQIFYYINKSRCPYRNSVKYDNIKLLTTDTIILNNRNKDGLGAFLDFGITKIKKANWYYDKRKNILSTTDHCMFDYVRYVIKLEV